VLAVAERAQQQSSSRPRRRLTDDDVAELTLLGFLALADPVRPAAAASVSALRDAGVQIIMITSPATTQGRPRRSPADSTY
jgi:cation-transporting ATPase I